MADILTPQARHAHMARIRTKGTQPEVRVRRWLYSRGARYRLNATALPGSPDIVFIGARTAVFVHGCFWHRHAGCRFAYTPKTRSDFWLAKFDANRDRDDRVERELRDMGWRVIVVWGCGLTDEALEVTFAGANLIPITRPVAGLDR